MGKLIDAVGSFERTPPKKERRLVNLDDLIEDPRTTGIQELTAKDLQILADRLRGEVPQNIVTTDFSQPR